MLAGDWGKLFVERCTERLSKVIEISAAKSAAVDVAVAVESVVTDGFGSGPFIRYQHCVLVGSGRSHPRSHLEECPTTETWEQACFNHAHDPEPQNLPQKSDPGWHRNSFPLEGVHSLDSTHHNCNHSNLPQVQRMVGFEWVFSQNNEIGKFSGLDASEDSFEPVDVSRIDCFHSHCLIWCDALG